MCELAVFMLVLLDICLVLENILFPEDWAVPVGRGKGGV